MNAIYGEAIPYVEGGTLSCFTPPYPYCAGCDYANGNFADGATSGLLIKPPNFPNTTDTHGSGPSPSHEDNSWVRSVNLMYGPKCTGGGLVHQIAGQLAVVGDYKQTAATTISDRWFSKQQWVSLDTFTISATFSYDDSTTTEGDIVVEPARLDTWWCRLYDGGIPTLLYEGPSDPNAPFTITWDESSMTETVSWGNISTSLHPLGFGGTFPSVRWIQVAYNRDNWDRSHIPGPDFHLSNACGDVSVSVSGLVSTPASGAPAGSNSLVNYAHVFPAESVAGGIVT